MVYFHWDLECLIKMEPALIAAFVMTALAGLTACLPRWLSASWGLVLPARMGKLTLIH